jgi:5-methylcytosine-specific restriction endonuclease McrA
MRRKKLSPDDYKRLRIEVLERDGWRCQRCGVRTNLDVHHIYRRARGGEDEAANLTSLCRNCHRAIHELAFVVKKKQAFEM